MKKNINYIKIITIFSLVFLASFITLFNGCEHQLAPDPVGVDRQFVGKVVEDGTFIGIANANITITVTVNGTKKYPTVTNDTGGFALTLPAYSESKAYLVTAYKEGYQQVDTFINCNCNTLILPVLKLKPAPVNCNYKIQTYATISNTVAIGDSALVTYEVENNNLNLELIISDVKITNSDLYLLDKLPLKVPVKPNNKKNLTFVFKPTQVKKPYEIPFQIKTSCDSNYINALFVGYSDLRRCDIDIPDAVNVPTYDTVYFVQLKTSPVVLINLSDISVEFTLSELKLSEYFVFMPGKTTNSFKKTVLGKNRDSVVIKFNPPGGKTGKYIDTLTISSNGGCSRKVVLIGIYNEIIKPNIVLVRWDQQLFYGYRFNDENSLVPDSINLCPPQLPFGQTQADFRFMGGVYANNGQPLYAILQAANGMKRLGNLNKDGKNFNLIDYPLVDKVSGWTNYCSQTYELNDVIAVRTRDNNYAIILIDNFYQFGGDGKEKIIFKFIYPVP